MRLIPYLAVGASLASAAPLSIIVSTTEVGSFRLGKPVHDAKTASVTMIAPGHPSRMRMACNKMQGGVAKLFALAGLGPAIPTPTPLAPEHHVAHFGHHGHNNQPIPVSSFWDPSHPPMHLENFNAESSPEPSPEHEHPHRVHHMFHGGPGHFRHYRHRGSFIRRIHRALMSLGPWEGRAIAFVLGCGIGVLLRMLWVMAVVIKRAIRGETDEEQSEDEAQYQRVAVLLPLDESEELFVAPPEYYADEKSPMPEPDNKN